MIISVQGKYARLPYGRTTSKSTFGDGQTKNVNFVVNARLWGAMR